MTNKTGKKAMMEILVRDVHERDSSMAHGYTPRTARSFPKVSSDSGTRIKKFDFTIRFSNGQLTCYDEVYIKL